MVLKFQVLLTVVICLCTTAQSQNCTLPPRLLSQSLDFKRCRLTIEDMTPDERSASGCFDGNVEDGVLTLKGCETVCGCGYDLWQWSDTFNRLSLLVLPTLFLIAHLAFPAAGWQNYLSIPCHAIGNPIGSLRSLLTRLETHRRLAREAEAAFPNMRVSMALATIAAAYEELGWQRISVDLGSLTPGEKNAFMHASHELSVARPASTFKAMIAIITLVITLTTAIIRTVRQLDQNDTRVFNETAHTIAVVCILFVTIPQVWFSARLGTFTTSSGAIRTLRALDRKLQEVSRITERQSPLLPPMQLAYCPLLPHQRHAWLVTRLPDWVHPWTRELFLHCPLDATSSFLPQSSRRNSSTKNGLFQDKWQTPSNISGINANHLGINSFWRPCKHLPHNEHGRGQVKIMFISILWVIFGSGLPAIFLSATNHADKRHVGIGCRSLSWITIISIWLFSFIGDSIIRFLCCRTSSRNADHRLKLIYRCTVFKDFIATAGVVTLVLLVQIGRWNSCWCRSSFSHPSIVVLMPYSGRQWTTAITLWASLPTVGLCVNLGLILWIELLKRDSNGSIIWFHKERGSPLCKSDKAMDFEFRDLGDVDDSDDSEEYSKKGPRVQQIEFIAEPETGRVPAALESESLLRDVQIARAYCRE